MKKTFTLLFSAISFFAAAQTLTVSQDTIRLAFGEKLDYGGSFIYNNGSRSIALDATIKPICKSPNDDTTGIIVCFGPLCFQPVSEEITYGAAIGTPVLDLLAGDSTDALKFEPITDGNLGSIWEMTFFDQNNPDASASIIFVIENCQTSSTGNLSADILKFSANPNPVSDVLNLTFAPLSEDGQLLIYNSLGQLVSECSIKRTTSTHPFDMNGFQSGTYFFRIVSGGDVSKMKKIFKH